MLVAVAMIAITKCMLSVNSIHPFEIMADRRRWVRLAEISVNLLNIMELR